MKTGKSLLTAILILSLHYPRPKRSSLLRLAIRITRPARIVGRIALNESLYGFKEGIGIFAVTVVEVFPLL